MAEINGGERYITLGCGHTMAFCKHANASGKTCEKILMCQDSDQIDVQKLFANVNYKTMIVEGWSWEIVPAIIDELWHAFARIAQRALNTQNHVSTEVGELETCMTIAASADDPGMRDLPDWKALAIENVVSLCVPCAHYSNTLLEFIVTHGGGTGAPLIVFMDAVAKQFSCNVSLGQGFWEALTHTQFASKTRKFPLLRVALGLANMTGDKLEDGIARLLKKEMVAGFTNKAKIGEAIKADDALQSAMDIAKALGGVDVVLKPLGQMFVRIGLLWTP